MQQGRTRIGPAIPKNGKPNCAAPISYSEPKTALKLSSGFYSNQPLTMQVTVLPPEHS